MFRNVLTGLLLLAVLGVSACTKGKKDEPKPKARATSTYATPQECFDAFVEAEKKHDSETYADCLAPDALKVEVTTLALFCMFQRHLAGRGGKDLEGLAKGFAPVFAVLDKHGLTKEATRHVNFEKGDDPREQEKARAAVAELLEDPFAFYVDLSAALDDGKPKTDLDDVKTTLREVEIDGDRATGTVLRLIPKLDTKPQVVKFVKIDGSWRIIPWTQLKENVEHLKRPGD